MNGLLRFNIHDRASGVCLCDHIVDKWDGDANPCAISSLVQLFHQFAREIDDGCVSRVLFQKTEVKVEKPVKKNYNSSLSLSSSSYQLQARSQRRKAHSIQLGTEMTCYGDDRLMCAVFFRSGYPEHLAQRFMTACLKRFYEEAHDELQSQRGPLDIAGKNPDTAILDKSFMKHFDFFEKTIREVLTETRDSVS